MAEKMFDKCQNACTLQLRGQGRVTDVKKQRVSVSLPLILELYGHDRKKITRPFY